ncbi:MAG: Hpt domain-containing protein, partial [Planctomycetaceae bacterium]|nr:Hpt domain-containing protein [Planctomycetaceae bacterium]
MEILDEIVSEFLVESYESLDQLDRDLMALEETPDDRDRIASIFRTIHTIKGTSGFLAFPLLEGVAHVGENLLVALRDGELTLTSDIANALLAMVDAVRSILANIEAGNGEGEDCYGDLKETLEQLRSGEAVPAPSAEIEVEAVVKELQPAKAAAKPAAKATAEVGGRKNSALTKNSGKASSKEEPEDEIVEDVCDSSDADEALAGNVDSMEAEVESRAVGKTSRAKANSKPSGNSGNGQGGSIAESSVRIDVHLLDKLMNLVGELVLARNQIMQFSQHSEDPALTAASQRVNLITTELQEGVMKTRMQPIRNAWAKLPRVVRDLSHSCGKQVQVKMEGADTELDKTILEAIKDPLTHIVRNSVDHGIESPKDRVAAGKPAEGTLLLRAYHEGGQVNIEIVDDGGGINIDRVRAKAVDKGLVTEEQAAAMTDREAV